MGDCRENLEVREWELIVSEHYLFAIKTVINDNFTFLSQIIASNKVFYLLFSISD